MKSKYRLVPIVRISLYVPITHPCWRYRLKLTFSISDLDNPPDTSDLAVEEGGEAAAPEPTFPVRASLNITKSGTPGALVLDLLVEDESFIIDNTSFYPEKALAEDMTAEGDWRRRGTYVGPRFDHLDEEVQSQFEQFLEERDVNANLGESETEGGGYRCDS